MDLSCVSIHVSYKLVRLYPVLFLMNPCLPHSSQCVNLSPTERMSGAFKTFTVESCKSYKKEVVALPYLGECLGESE